MTFQTQFPQLLQRIKADSPLIHCITNHISIHDSKDTFTGNLF